MPEKKPPHKIKNKHGGTREGSGRPAELKGGKYVLIYLDENTDKVLKQIDKNRSKAIRILAGTEKQDPLE